jgi:hypothetical protein
MGKAAMICRFMGGNFFGMTRPQTRGHIIRGIDRYKHKQRAAYRVDFRFRLSNVEGTPIHVEPVIIDGRHYGGMAYKGHTYLHSGYGLPGGSRNLYKDPMDIGEVLTHEILHTRGLGHNPDKRDVMHPYVGKGWTVSLPWFKRTFGMFRMTKSVDESAIETGGIERIILAGRREGCPVGAFRPSKSRSKEK